MREVVVERIVGSSPDVVYGLVSDVTRMGEWSPETTSCRWVGGATGPVAGARFRGSNRMGWRRWSTTCSIVEAEPGRRFSFDVKFAGLPISRWSYEFSPEGDRCTVRERWEDRRRDWVVRAAGLLMGVADRAQHNRATMEQTVANLAGHFGAETTAT